MRIAYVSTDDLGRARNRVLIEGLTALGHEIHSYNYNAWLGFSDKTFATSLRDKLRVVARYFLAYPRVLFRYAISSRHDVVIVPYMGLFDLLAVWPLARIRGEVVVWDAFISMYNTVVEDRKLFPATHPLSRILLWLEGFVTKLPHLVLLDTAAHARYFQQRYGIADDRIAAVFIGAAQRAFEGATAFNGSDALQTDADGKINVIFVGTFIPLQGVDTVFAAAAQTPPELAHWYIIGRGQEEERIEAQWNVKEMKNVTRIRWIEYGELLRFIDEKADVCLGIFGATDKAARVIPNKFYESLARRRPAITRDSEAMRELLSDQELGVWLIPPADPAALSAAVLHCRSACLKLHGYALFEDIRQQIMPQALATKLVTILQTRGLIARETP